MAQSRALFEDQSAPPLTEKEVAKNKKNPDRLIDKIPGDKGSTVDKIREVNKKRKEAMEE